jgi:uncharacterized protein
LKTYLLDVNVLVAMAWPTHSAHERVRRWLGTHEEVPWSTCAFTEAGFVRILSNPAFSRNALSLQNAITLLETYASHPNHTFWSTDIGLSDAIRLFRDRLVGHQQIADAYLLGLAIHKRAILATLDRGIFDLLPPGATERSAIELIGK